MSFLQRIKDCQAFEMTEYTPFLVEDMRIGLVRSKVADELAIFFKTLLILDDAMHISPDIQGCEERTLAMAAVTEVLFERGLISGWRDELYPVAQSFDAPALFHIERAAAPLFGVKAYGVHINGWVETKTGPAMWVGRRSINKSSGPGLLDQMVAGGQPSGISVMDNVIKECAEEASIPREIAMLARPVGAVSYCMTRDEGLRDDVLFNFDLQLPDDFRPVNMDGEVDEFMLWPLADVASAVAKDGIFKFNSGLVAIDFLLRHGFITPHEPGYAKIVSGLRASPANTLTGIKRKFR
ncbi:MAG: hypothetical protein CBB68_02160 [Rhodospirillaceae bacterium TMED8]|nr:DUF4743 domain-containing protein [Magnetovibrio sp.]OUT52181.1 MAG: hypothetical protein CBB68_02160 [Rhodospirillaceae bacterium TMED8]